jgi:hypothetical protein
MVPALRCGAWSLTRLNAYLNLFEIVRATCLKTTDLGVDPLEDDWQAGLRNGDPFGDFFLGITSRIGVHPIGDGNHEGRLALADADTAGISITAGCGEEKHQHILA